MVLAFQLSSSYNGLRLLLTMYHVLVIVPPHLLKGCLGHGSSMNNSDARTWRTNKVINALSHYISFMNRGKSNSLVTAEGIFPSTG